MSSALTGRWREVSRGTSLDDLKPSGPRGLEELTLREDGTAEWKMGAHEEDDKATPFPTTWEISEENRLSIWLPIPPMPEYDMPEWSREELCYSILKVSPDSLILSDRPYDGEFVTVFKRLE